VMGARREEDRRALALLLARPLWLEFCDSQYRRSPTIDDVVDALREAMAQAEPTAVFFPLGLFHEDHKLAHEAGLRLMRRHPWPAWFAYEDAIYRRIRGLVNDRLTKLEAAGFMPTLVTGGSRSASDLKRKAMGCYRSQLRALSTPGRPGYQDALAEERFWHLVFSHDRVE
jgi:LmbE family N-acetylglucosaminyl deacetylase